MGLDAAGHDVRRDVGNAAGLTGQGAGISRVLAGFLLAAGLAALGGCAARAKQPAPPSENRPLPEITHLFNPTLVRRHSVIAPPESS